MPKKTETRKKLQVALLLQITKGRSVARCPEPVNVIYCYITILIQPEAQISLLDESVLSPTV